MDDYNSNLLNESQNEWSIRLTNILSGHIIDGFRSIFNEALTLCEKNDELEKYLMTFQNLLSKVKDWNQITVENECKRISETSRCPYIEDMITCVHIIQLKILSCVRVSSKNKKIDIDIPDFKMFLHKVYVNIARKLYSNIYLFQVDISPLEQQKHNREFEYMVQTCIMNTIRDNIPVDQILRQYIDETQEVDVERLEQVVQKKEEPKPVETPVVPQTFVPPSTPAPTVESMSTPTEPANIVQENNSDLNVSFNMDNNTVKEIENNSQAQPQTLSLDEPEEIMEYDPFKEENTTLNISNDLAEVKLDDISSLENELNNELKTNSEKIDLGIETLEL